MLTRFAALRFRTLMLFSLLLEEGRKRRRLQIENAVVLLGRLLVSRGTFSIPQKETPIDHIAAVVDFHERASSPILHEMRWLFASRYHLTILHNPYTIAVKSYTMPDCSEVRSVLQRHESTLIVTHTHADLDTLGSAIGLERAFPGAAQIVIPDGVQARADRLPQTLDIDLSTPDEVDVATADCLVVVDAPSTERIAPVAIDDTAGDVVVVDHHEPDDLANRATATAIDTDAGATATLVAGLITNTDWQLDADGGVALAAGLLDDTGSLTTATPGEFALLGDLLDAAGTQVDALPQILAREPSFSERVAATKAVVRATGYRADRTLVLTTQVGGQQTAAARTLREAGADIALVISDRGSQTWVVGRAAPEQVHLPASVFTPLVEQYGGDGGGHAGAGVAKLDTGTPDEIRATALDCIEAALGGPLSELS